jgi:hypothetical protein
MAKHYRAIEDIIRGAARIPAGTCFRMPDEWQPDANSALVTGEWLREFRARYLKGDEHGPLSSKEELKRQLRIELQLLRLGFKDHALSDVDDIRHAVMILYRMGEFGDQECGQFLHELCLAEGRALSGDRQVVRVLATA